jgi:hypothetical protein
LSHYVGRSQFVAPGARANVHHSNKQCTRDADDARMQQHVVSFISGACLLKFCEPNMPINPPQCGADEGLMNDLIGRFVDRPGVDRAAAKTSVGIILEFLLREAGSPAAGLSTTQIQGITHEITSFARDNAVDDAASDIVGAAPGQFI